jgi:tRNA uridine 5-carboxymethylaminomethyl modification enzyme
MDRERWLPDEADRARLAGHGVVLESPTTTAAIVRRPEVDADAVAGFSAAVADLSPDERRIAVETVKYAGYVARQARDAERVRKAGATRIPAGFAYEGLPGLSTELAQKLEAVRPETVGQASRIEGMTPAALSLLVVHVARGRRAGAAR